MNEKEIVEDGTAVGAMMPITMPDQVLQKVTPESVDEAFDAMRIKPTDEDDDIDECGNCEESFEESVIEDIFAKVRLKKCVQRIKRENSNYQSDSKEFSEIIKEVENYLSQNDKSFVPYNLLKRKISSVPKDDVAKIRDEFSLSKSDGKLTIIQLLNSKDLVAVFVVNEFKNKEYEFAAGVEDGYRKYWQYYYDSFCLKYLHGSISISYWKKVLEKINSGSKVNLESGDDKIIDLMKSVGIKPVYESVMENKSEFDIYFESEEDYVFEEAAKIDSDLRDIIKTLNEKGYETLYSCSGHPSARLKSDGKKDGIKYGKLYSTARIVFAEDYDLPNVPTGWVKKILKDDDKVKVSIYVKAPAFHIINGLPVDQFNKWKARYMYHLENWVKELPKVEDLKDTGSGEVATESADALEYADNLIMECMIDML